MKREPLMSSSRPGAKRRSRGPRAAPRCRGSARAGDERLGCLRGEFTQRQQSIDARSARERADFGCRAAACAPSSPMSPSTSSRVPGICAAPQSRRAPSPDSRCSCRRSASAMQAALPLQPAFHAGEAREARGHRCQRTCNALAAALRRRVPDVVHPRRRHDRARLRRAAS